MAYVRHQTLTASTVATFTMTGNESGVEIMNRNGAGEVYISYDGTASPANPTVAGNDFDVIPAATGAALQLRRVGGQNSIVVKLISAQATAVTVRGLA